MDDQNIGVMSHAKGLEALAFVGQSLARLHLTPNAKKSAVWSLAQAKDHFHLDLNRRLDEAAAIKPTNMVERRRLRRAVMDIWSRARGKDGVGHWDKIMKRLYREAVRAKVTSLRRHAALPPCAPRRDRQPASPP
jgi:hypothetical protein